MGKAIAEHSMTWSVRSKTEPTGVCVSGEPRANMQPILWFNKDFYKSFWPIRTYRPKHESFAVPRWHRQTATPLGLKCPHTYAMAGLARNVVVSRDTSPLASVT